MPDFPSAVPDIPDSNTTETLFTMHGAIGHVSGTNRILANLRALATKLGINNGTGPPATGAVLRRTATGESGWGLLVDVDVAAAGAANIAVGKLAHVGPGMVLKSNGTINVAGQVANADIAAAGTAQIAPGKLDSGATANRVLATLTGVAGSAAMQQVATAMIAPNAVTQVTHAQGPATNFGTAVAADITGVSVTLTLTGGDLLVWAIAGVSHSVSGGRWQAAIDVPGVVSGPFSIIGSVNSLPIMSVAFLRVPAVAAATRTASLRITPFDAGTLSVLANCAFIVAMEVKK